MNFEIKNGILRKYTGDNPIVIIPDNVTRIDYGAFKNRKDIKRVFIPQSVSLIDSWVFAGCKSLESVQIMGIATLRDAAFYKCVNLREFIVPQGLKEIGDGAFMGCLHLNSDFLSEKTFELWTFVGDRDLKDVTYPEETEVCKRQYSWNEYKRISAEVLEYSLISREEGYNELEGPEIPTVKERNIRIADDMILLNREGHFIGCLLESEHVFYVGRRESDKSRVIAKLDGKSVNLFYQNGNHMPFDMYEKEDAYLIKGENI